MAMFGSENPAMMGGGGANFGGSMDPMLLEAMMKNMPEVKARQRRAEQLRGMQEKFGAMGQGPAGNYTHAQQGGLYPTIQKFHTDYGKIGDAIVGAAGSYATGKMGEKAQVSADQMMGNEVLGAAQAFGGGNTGGRMGDYGTGMGAGLQAPPSGMAMPNIQGGMVTGAPGVGNTGPGVGGGGVIPGGGPPGGMSPGAGPNPVGQMRQNMGMNLRGNAALANLSRWFGQ